MHGIQVGQVVQSIAGRDQGRLYIVWMVDDKFIHLVDGRSKKLETAKRKRYKHIIAVGILEDTELLHIRDGVRDGSAASRIRTTLKRYSNCRFDTSDL